MACPVDYFRVPVLEPHLFQSLQQIQHECAVALLLGSNQELAFENAFVREQSILQSWENDPARWYRFCRLHLPVLLRDSVRRAFPFLPKLPAVKFFTTEVVAVLVQDDALCCGIHSCVLRLANQFSAAVHFTAKALYPCLCRRFLIMRSLHMLYERGFRKFACYRSIFEFDIPNFAKPGRFVYHVISKPPFHYLYHSGVQANPCDVFLRWTPQLQNLIRLRIVVQMFDGLESNLISVVASFLLG
jgi:hypothetical protein